MRVVIQNLNFMSLIRIYCNMLVVIILCHDRYKIFTTLFDDLRTTNLISHVDKLIFHIFAVKIIGPFDIRAFK